MIWNLVIVITIELTIFDESEFFFCRMTIAQNEKKREPAGRTYYESGKLETRMFDISEKRT